MFDTIPFNGDSTARFGIERDDPVWIADRLADPASRLLPMHRLHALARTGPTPGLCWLPYSDLPGSDALPTVLLGRHNGACHFAVDVTETGEADAPQWLAHGQFLDARTLAAVLPLEESALLAQARSLTHWHARHRYCAVCGRPTQPTPAGHRRHCGEPACGAEHYPRVDPVVIMLVTDGDRCIMARQPHFAAGMQSCLAGFVEPGETLEAAVRREVMEEVGIRVGAVRYLGSQPWPFPSALMLGCHAEALDSELHIDPNEIESAHWFDRGQVRQMLADSDSERSPRASSKIAIAHHLIRAWVDA